MFMKWRSTDGKCFNIIVDDRSRCVSWMSNLSPCTWCGIWSERWMDKKRAVWMSFVIQKIHGNKKADSVKIQISAQLGSSVEWKIIDFFVSLHMLQTQNLFYTGTIKAVNHIEAHMDLYTSGALQSDDLSLLFPEVVTRVRFGYFLLGLLILWGIFLSWNLCYFKSYILYIFSTLPS